MNPRGLGCSSFKYSRHSQSCCFARRCAATPAHSRRATHAANRFTAAVRRPRGEAWYGTTPLGMQGRSRGHRRKVGERAMSHRRSPHVVDEDQEPASGHRSSCEGLESPLGRAVTSDRPPTPPRLLAPLCLKNSAVLATPRRHERVRHGIDLPALRFHALTPRQPCSLRS